MNVAIEPTLPQAMIGDVCECEHSVKVDRYPEKRSSLWEGEQLRVNVHSPRMRRDVRSLYPKRLNLCRREYMP